MSAELQAQPITTNRWVLGARPLPLPAAVAPVLVGTAVGVWTSVGAEDRFSFIAWRFICALIVAVAVQVATNYANDYSDGKRESTILVSGWALPAWWAMGWPRRMRSSGRCSSPSG